MIEIDKDVYQFNRMKSGQIYLLQEEDGLTLIDTGMQGDFKKIKTQIGESGLSIESIDNIILTHCHSDHCANASKLKELSNARIIAHEIEAPYIEGRDRIQYGRLGSRLMFGISNTIFRVRPVRVDMRVKDGELIAVGEGLRVIHTPGHTPGSMALYHEDKKMLFSGDSIWNHKNLKIAQGLFNTDDEEMMRSVERFLELDIEKICVGHGTSILEEGGKKLQELLS